MAYDVNKCLTYSESPVILYSGPTEVTNSSMFMVSLDDFKNCNRDANGNTGYSAFLVFFTYNYKELTTDNFWLDISITALVVGKITTFSSGMIFSHQEPSGDYAGFSFYMGSQSLIIDWIDMPGEYIAYGNTTTHVLVLGCV